MASSCADCGLRGALETDNATTYSGSTPESTAWSRMLPRLTVPTPMKLPGTRRRGPNTSVRGSMYSLEAMPTATPPAGPQLPWQRPGLGRTLQPWQPRLSGSRDYGHHTHRAPDWAGSRHVYRPRRPTTTPLYPVAPTSVCSRSPVRGGACAHQRWGTRHAIRAAWPRSPPTSLITCCPTLPCDRGS